MTSIGAKRILVIGFFHNRGGLEASTMNYYRRMNHERIQYDFINPYDTFHFENEIYALGGKVYRVSNFKKRPLGYVKDVVSIIRTYKYTTVYLPMLSAINPLAQFAAKVAGAKVVIHSHNSMTKGMSKRMLHAFFKPIVNMLADYKWACSSEAGRWMFYGKYRIVNNAIDLKLFAFRKSKRNRLRNELHIAPSDYVIGNVARLVPEKNQTHLIRIIAEMYTKRDDVKLLLVGSGADMDRLARLSRELRVDDKIVFAGDRSDVADLYSAMDVFVLPSFFEGLPVVGIEAQAAGLPIVCSDIVTREMNVSGNVSYIGLDSALSVWTNKILSVARMAQKDAEKVLTRNGYNIETEVKKLESFYLELRDGELA